MFSIARYLCMGLGAALILAGWLVISSETVQQDAVDGVGRMVALEMLGGASPMPAPTGEISAAPTADDKSWSFLGPQIGSWVRSVVNAASGYLLGIVVIVLGAALLGLAVPSGSFGSGEAPCGSGANRACLLMLAMAALFLTCGFAAYYTSDFRGGQMFLGTRSSIILLVCALLTSLIRRSRLIGLIGYYSGLLVTPVLGLNFLRLLLKQPITVESLDLSTIAKVLMAGTSFIAIVLLWRAIPSGIERARMSLQVRRLAAGTGAAVLLAGICITKASVLPQHALAEGRAADILDNPEIQTTLVEMGVPQELIEASREKLAEMGTGMADVDELQAAAAEVISEWQRANPDQPLSGRGRELVQAIQSRTSSRIAVPVDGGTSTASADVSQLLRDLSPADMQKLAAIAGVDVDLNDPQVREKITREAQNVDLNDPRVAEALAKAGLDQPTPLATSPADPPQVTDLGPSQSAVDSPVDGATCLENRTGHGTGANGHGAPPTDPSQPMTVRQLPSKIVNRVPDERLTGDRITQGERPTYRTPRPSISRSPEIALTGSEQSRFESDPIEIPLANLIRPVDHQFAFDPAFMFEADSPCEVGENNEERNREEAKEETQTEMSAEAVAPPPPLPALPPPPPPASPDRVSHLQQKITDTANRAGGYGLLATLVGSIVFLGAVLLRRVGRSGAAAAASA